MKVHDIMTSSVDAIAPADTIRSAARAMAENDEGALPVVDHDKVVGMVTDRDITVRAVAAGKSIDSPVSGIMTKNVRTCYARDEVEEAVQVMADEQVRRLPVVDPQGSLIGIVTLADAARSDRDHRKEVAAALSDICNPSGEHRQSMANA